MPDGKWGSITDLIIERVRNVLDRLEILRVRVGGVEVTQGIQYFDSSSHLTDVNDQGANNSVTLVAEKPAWVRVYVRSVLEPSVTGVTGELRIERRQHGFIWNDVATLAPTAPGGVTAQSSPDYAAERGDINATLNFVIPATDFFGVLRLTAVITDAGGDQFDTHTEVIDVTLHQTLRVRAILVAYDGPSTSSPPPGTSAPNIQIAAPTIADVQATAGLALRAMPVGSTGSFVSGGSITLTVPLDDPRTGAGGCSTNWGTFMTQLVSQRTADGNRQDVVYYGLLPIGVPLGVPGCGQDGLGSAVTGNERTFLHEIGHGYGFQHTPCGNTGTADPNYPTYEPYPSASIGEYGLDISNGNIRSPQATSDYMSYCPPRWMSLYQHSRLIGHSRLDPTYHRDEPWLEEEYRFEPIPEWVVPEWWLPDPPPYDPWKWIDMKPENVISLMGIVHADSEIEVRTVARVSAIPTVSGAPTSYVSLLLDEKGEALAQARLFRLDHHGDCGCMGGSGEHRDHDKPPFAFQALIPDVAPGSELRIRTPGGEDAWRRQGSREKPSVRASELRVDKDRSLILRWDAEKGSAIEEVWIQWSKDEGKTWRGLATGIIERDVELPLAGLPSGTILIRILAHDGFQTGFSAATSVDIPPQSAAVAILSPRQDETLFEGRPLHLWAAVTDPSGIPLDDDVCHWVLDGDVVARGRETWIEVPPAGDHEVSLVVEHEDHRDSHYVAFRSVAMREGQER